MADFMAKFYSDGTATIHNIRTDRCLCQTSGQDAHNFMIAVLQEDEPERDYVSLNHRVMDYSEKWDARLKGMFLDNYLLP